MKKMIYFALSAIGLLMAGCQPSEVDVVDKAIDEARQSVIQYGRGGTIAQKRQAAAVICRHLPPKKNKGKNRNQIGIGDMRAARVAYQLRQVRKGSPDPNLQGGALTSDERAILEATNEPITVADVQRAEAAVREDMRSSDAQRRKSAAARLADFGEAGLPVLAELMRDANHEVASLAASNFVAGVMVINDDRETAACAKAGMLATQDTTMLERLGMALVMAAENRPAVEAIIGVIENGIPNQVKAAKEAYASITGDEWVSKPTAEAWIKENCEEERNE